MLGIERLSCVHIPYKHTGHQMRSSVNEFMFWAALLPNQFFMTFPLALPWSELQRVELQNMRLVPWCKRERWFNAEVRERGNMSHIYVMLMTPAIRHTGSLCSDCLLSPDEYVLSVLWELSKICLWSPHEDLVPSQPLCCLLKFAHLWTLYTERTWALFAFIISSAAHSRVIHKSSFLCIVNMW